MKSVGYERFMRMNRNKLILYTTFEPCEMCLGTLQHYNIKMVVFLKEKSLVHWWRNSAKSFYYRFYKADADKDNVQDSLFQKHPEYPGNK